VLDYWMALVTSARRHGGEVIVLLGNHEAEFLADPDNSKATELRAELVGISAKTFASASNRHGRFLRERPIAALIDGWFFSHSGNSQGNSIAEIGDKFVNAADANHWDAHFLLDSNSILEAREWWPRKNTRAFLDGYLAALPARHFVFGHDPNGFADPPTGDIEVHSQGRLLLIDVGMSGAVNYSHGKLLRIDRPGSSAEAASMITSKGAVVPLDLVN
jgi:hypothetical protein